MANRIVLVFIRFYIKKLCGEKKKKRKETTKISPSYLRVSKIKIFLLPREEREKKKKE